MQSLTLKTLTELTLDARCSARHKYKRQDTSKRWWHVAWLRRTQHADMIKYKGFWEHALGQRAKLGGLKEGYASAWTSQLEHETSKEEIRRECGQMQLVASKLPGKSGKPKLSCMASSYPLREEWPKHYLQSHCYFYTPVPTIKTPL